MSTFREQFEMLMRLHNIDGALVITLKQREVPEDSPEGTMECAMTALMPADDRVAQLTIMACKEAADKTLHTMAEQGMFKSVTPDTPDA